MAQIVTPHYRISPNDRITINGIDYRLHAHLARGYLLERLASPGVKEEFNDERYHELTRAPGFRYEQGLLGAIRQSLKHHTDAEFLADLSAEQQKKVAFRLDYCRRFLKLEAACKKLKADDTKRKKAGDKKLTPAPNVSRSDRGMAIAVSLIKAEMDREAEREAAGRDEEGNPKKLRPFADIGGKKPPSAASLLRWVKLFENAGLSPVALCDGYDRSGRTDARLDRDIRVLLADYAVRYASDHKPSIKSLHHQLVAEITLWNEARAEAGSEPLAAPSYETLRLEVDKLPKFDVYAGRNGLAAAMKKFAMISGGPDVVEPLQRVEIDTWRADIMTWVINAGLLEQLSPELREELEKKPVRVWVSVAMDAASRVILGMRIGLGANTDLTLQTLEMVVSDKKHYAEFAGARSTWPFCGTPMGVVNDQGAELMNAAVRRVLTDMGCDPDSPPAGQAHLRGRIERVLRTISIQALAPFSGRTFGSVEERGDYNAALHACLTVDDLARVLVRWVVDVYHLSPHAGLGGETPADAWNRLVKKYDLPPPIDRHKRRAIFGVPVQRVLGPKGIVFLGVHYNCQELQALRRKLGDVTIEVRVDPLDLGNVSARVGTSNKWMAVPCMRAGFDDVTIETWARASADLRRRYAAEAAFNDDIVHAAIRDAAKFAQDAAERAGITALRVTREQLDAHERRIGRAFQTPAQKSAAAVPVADDLTTVAIPTKSSAPPNSAPAAGADVPAPKVRRVAKKIPSQTRDR